MPISTSSFRPISGDEFRRRMDNTPLELFNHAFMARGEPKMLLEDDIKRRLSAKELMDAAIESFRDRGNGERMLYVANLLSEYGMEALGPLREIGEKGSELCTYFIDLLVDLADLNVEQVLPILNLWVQHPLQSVRSDFLTVSDVLPDSLEFILRKKEDQCF